MNFAECLNDYLENKTAKSLSELSGVSQSAISTYRDGKEPTPECKAKLAGIIGYVEEEPEPEFEPEIEYVPLEEAAARMGWGLTKLQCALRAKEFGFGSGFKGNGDHYIYYILRTDFEEFIEKHKSPQ